jgi:hypothetical protein
MYRFYVVTQYKESLDWLNSKGLTGIIYAKGGLHNNIEGFASIQVDNYGGNQYDIVKFIYENYDNLPNLITFLQGNPFDHCEERAFWSLIKQNYFTCFESYGPSDMGKSSRKSEEIDGGFCELNNSWYVGALNKHLITKDVKLTCPVDHFDEFMNTIFLNYQNLKWLRFTPGSQYTVEKERCLHYSRNFWRFLVDFIPKGNVNGGTEAHVLERALWHIFNGTYQQKSQDEMFFSVKEDPHVRFHENMQLKNRIRKKLKKLLM